MLPLPPSPLPENARLAFLGDDAWPPALLTARQAENLAAAPNACGRPNSDVLRRRLAVVDGEPVESWQIDFPGHFTAQEAALYQQPFAWLRERSPGGAWLNPHANPALRRALARVSRFLARPANAAGPDWRWIEEDVLPDASLLVVVREDDFTRGVLQSAAFAAWWLAHRPGLAPDLAVGSFPFPWPPATALSALTAAQEEHRHAVARATRDDDPAKINPAVLAAYGWTTAVTDGELLENLTALRRKRSR